MAQESTSVEEGQATQSENTSRDNHPAPLEIIIVEIPGQNAAAAEREQNARELEAAKLDAQIRAADAVERSAAAAERAEIPALVISIAGTFVAVLAFIFTLVSNRRSERIAKAHTRAYIGVEEAKVLDPPDKPLHFNVTLRNNGNSPATITKLLFAAMIVQGKYDSSLREQATPRSAGTIPPNGSITLHAAITSMFLQGVYESIKAGHFSAFVFLHVEYRDVFGDTQVLETTRVAYKTDMRAGLMQTPDMPDRHYEAH